MFYFVIGALYNLCSFLQCFFLNFYFFIFYFLWGEWGVGGRGETHHVIMDFTVLETPDFVSLWSAYWYMQQSMPEGLETYQTYINFPLIYIDKDRFAGLTQF